MLVVIGLVVGGTLLALDLIDQANMRKDMGTIEKYNSAVSAFKLKYNGLPGDITNPIDFGFDAAARGDGNGRIQGIIASYSLSYTAVPSAGLRPEWFYVVHHLGKAGLIELSGTYDTSASTEMIAGTQYPSMYTSSGGGTDNSGGYGAGILLAYENNNWVHNHYFRMGAGRYTASASSVAFFASFTPAKAKRIDTKFDDGMPTTGTIQIAPLLPQCADDIYDTSSGSCKFGGIALSSDAWHCALLSTGDYDTSYNFRSCSLRVKAAF